MFADIAELARDCRSRLHARRRAGLRGACRRRCRPAQELPEDAARPAPRHADRASSAAGNSRCGKPAAALGATDEDETRQTGRVGAAARIRALRNGPCLPPCPAGMARGAIAMPNADYCAIDFGTSNSSVAVLHEDGVRLVTLEGAETSLPTAVFYDADDATQLWTSRACAPRGWHRRAIDAFDQEHPRLRSDGRGDGDRRWPGGALRRRRDRLPAAPRSRAEAATAPHRGGRARPASSSTTTIPNVTAARRTRFAEAARIRRIQRRAVPVRTDRRGARFESRSTREHLVLVADIGGGTSDFSVVRTSPQRHARLDRRDDILANHGVHVAGTDFSTHRQPHGDHAGIRLRPAGT